MEAVDYLPAGNVADVPEGEIVRAEIAGKEIAIYNVGGAFFATEGLCTHGYASLAEGYLDDHVVECRMHGGTFDVRTGKAVSAPCTVDLKTYAVKVEGDRLLIAVPREVAQQT
jgi:nitrite reductase/ring-hydroxylating ferredoxin subunit